MTPSDKSGTVSLYVSLKADALPLEHQGHHRTVDTSGYGHISLWFNLVIGVKRPANRYGYLRAIH